MVHTANFTLPTMMFNNFLDVVEKEEGGKELKDRLIKAHENYTNSKDLISEIRNDILNGKLTDSNYNKTLFTNVEYLDSVVGVIAREIQHTCLTNYKKCYNENVDFMINVYGGGKLTITTRY